MKKFWSKVNETDIRNILAIIITLGTFFLFYLLIIKEVPKENSTVVNIAVGFIMGSGFGGVVGYFFSASKKSDGNKNSIEP